MSITSWNIARIRRHCFPWSKLQSYAVRITCLFSVRFCILYTRENPSAQKQSWTLCLIKKQITNKRNGLQYFSTDPTQHTTCTPMLHISAIWTYITSRWLVFLIRFVVLRNYYRKFGKYLKLDDTVSSLILSRSLSTNHNVTESIYDLPCNFLR